MVENEKDCEFTNNTHKSTAFKEAPEGVLNAHDINKDGNSGIDSDQKQIFGKPHALNFSFECDIQIKSWEGSVN